MRIVKKNVYYCENCGKRSLRPLIKHEKHCTLNPDRECRLCGRESIKEIIDKYREYFKVIEVKYPAEFEDRIEVRYIKEFILDDIKRELEYNCPICLFAIIRCLGLNRYWFKKKFDFDYKKELSGWWDAANVEENRWGAED